MFVFVYSPYSVYHLKLSFLHLIVILKTLETPWKIFSNTNLQIVLNTKKKFPSQIKPPHPKPLPKNPGIENFNPLKNPSINSVNCNRSSPLGNPIVMLP